MKKILYLSIVIILFIAFTLIKTKEIDYNSFLYKHVPMPMDTAQSLQYKWDHKEILASELIDGMESLENWELSFGNKENVATFSLSNEKVFEGKSAVKFVSPTKLPVQLGNGGRYWGRQNLSQSSWQTADATAIFFRLARKYQTTNEKLSKRLLEEEIWGQPAFRFLELLDYLYN